jgi:hypothetical protein
MAGVYLAENNKIMADNYSYNPSANIRQTFKDISGSMEDIFTHIVEQKQRDYSLVSNMAANIESLKEKVNMYGRQDITNKANNLVQDLASAIKPDGTLDHAKLAMATQAVTRIKQEKQAWEDKAELEKSTLTNLIAQKDFIPNMQKAVNDVRKITMDPNILNPQDAQRHYGNAVENNLNEMSILNQTYQTIRPKANINGVIKNPDGSYTSWKGQTYQGMVYDPKTKTSSRPAMTMVPGPNGTQVPISTKDYDYQLMEKNHPEVIDMLVRKAGPGADLIPMENRRKEILNMNIDKLSSDVTESFIKPPAPKRAAAAKTSGGTELVSSSLITIPGVGPANSQSLGKNVKLKIGPTTQAIASEIGRASDGNFYANILIDESGNPWQDENNLQGAKTVWKKMGLNPAELKSVIGTTSAMAFPEKLKGKMASSILNLKTPKGTTPQANPPAPAGGVNPATVVGKTPSGTVVTEGMIKTALEARKTSGKPISREDYLKEKKIK